MFLNGSFIQSQEASASALCVQAAILYALNQTFIIFSSWLGQTVNLDVDPNSGAVGLDGYDTYKVLSALFMTLHKYGIFAIYIIYAWHSCYIGERISGPQDELPTTRAKQKNSPSSSFFYSLSNLTLSVHIFHNLVTSLSFYFLLNWITRSHPYEQSLCITMLSATMTTVLLILFLVEFTLTKYNWKLKLTEKEGTKKQ